MSQNEKKNAYARDYYKKNADKINARRRELYKSRPKKVKENNNSNSNSNIKSIDIESSTSPSQYTQCTQLTPFIPYSVPYSFMYVVLTTLCVKSQVNLISKLW
jgi:hypothetical protein